MRRHATPPWWDWPLELTPHIKRRMRQRRFSETDLRSMLATSVRLAPDAEDGRFLVECRLGREHWDVVVEPDFDRCILWAITAYRTS
jgi:hypothetical protein